MNTDLEPYQGGTPEPTGRPQVPSIASDLMPPRLPEVGRIRCGEKETKTVTRGGKQVEVTFPKRLGTFRFTSRERPLIEQVAKLYGGTVKPWASDEGPQWQVTSEANSIEVIVPTADLAFSQYFELWDGGGCQRRCDGHYEMLGDSQCRCNPVDRKAGKEGSCKPTTRLGVFLPGVKGLGVWRLESHGKNAGSEIKGSVMLIAAYGAGLTRATLTTAVRPGRQRKPDGTYTPVRYVVPTLISSDDIGEYVDRAQLEASPVQGVLPAPFEYPDPHDDFVKALHATYREKHPRPLDADNEEYRNLRLDWASEVLGRPVLSFNGPDYPETLTRADVQTLLDALESTPALTREQAAPSSSPDAASAAGAASTAPQGSAGTQAPPGRDASAAGANGPAEHHKQGSAGQIAQETSQTPENVLATAPAEHHTAEGSFIETVTANTAETVAEWQAASQRREVAPADGTVPAGESRSDTGPSVGPAPAKSAPTRKRHKTDPTGAPGVKEAMAQAQQFRDDRKAQIETWQPPSNWLQTLPPEAVYNLVTYFERGGARDPNYAAEAAARAFARHRVSPSMPPLASWAEATEWAPAQLAQLAAETWDRPSRKGDPE